MCYYQCECTGWNKKSAPASIELDIEGRELFFFLVVQFKELELSDCIILSSVWLIVYFSHCIAKINY